MSSFLARLRKHKDDRGMMANLRCILVESKKHRAWPALHRLGIAIENDIAAFVAGLFATHPEIANNGNFGSTCKSIARQRDNQQGEDNKLTPTERRFQHLLSAEPGDELNKRVLRMVLMAKTQGVAVNYEKLLQDMKRWQWDDRAKTEWAASYWAPKAESVEEEAV
jgi:CRISPR system Cascade subunit CasB